MQWTSDILILAEQSGRTENLIFLLRLSNFQVTHITSDMEAFNYLAQRQQGRRPVDLPLIDGFGPQFLQLLDELDRCDAMLPILLAYKEEPLPLDQLKCKESLKSLIQQCQTHETHACVREIIHTHSQVHSQVS